jgi:hypothetical protein
MDFSHLPQFKITGEQSQEYGELVKNTCTLLKREYHQIHLMFTRERWTLEEIRDTYQKATKHHGNVTPQIAWWADRKRRNAKMKA